MIFFSFLMKESFNSGNLCYSLWFFFLQFAIVLFLLLLLFFFFFFIIWFLERGKKKHDVSVMLFCLFLCEPAKTESMRILFFSFDSTGQVEYTVAPLYSAHLTLTSSTHLLFLFLFFVSILMSVFSFFFFIKKNVLSFLNTKITCWTKTVNFICD